MSTPDAAALHAAFEAVEPLTIGLEEELLLFDPRTLDLAPCARALLERTGGDPRFKLELPAAQIEIVTRAHPSVPQAIAELAGGRRDLARAADGLARPAAAAVHPFADPEGVVNSEDERYAAVEREFAAVARCQVVSALQVHVAVGGAERTLAVYNALRGHLPELAALAAAAPWYAGRDTGLASARAAVAAMLPRQGVPPAIASWGAWSEDLRWGDAAGATPNGWRWWWELRPHPGFGTLELRVPDVQATVVEAASVAAVAHALVAWLAARHDEGEPLPVPADWRIAANRWSALRHGVAGELADLVTGERRPTRERLHALLDELAPHAREVGCPGELESARELVEVNGAMRLRELAGPQAAAAWLADRFVQGCSADARAPVRASPSAEGG